MVADVKKIRVLVVDDSALVRDILKAGLSMDPALEVVATAGDPYQARDKIIELRPDVMTLDVEMPRMDGVEFVRRLMPQFPMPIIMVSSLTERGGRITLDALDAGALDFVTKPATDLARGMNAMMVELREKVKMASRANVSHFRKGVAHVRQAVAKPAAALAKSTDKVVVIGASTGGTEAIKDVLECFPSTMPGVVIVQHMPAGFTGLFAKRLNNSCQMDVKEAEDGERVMPGRVLIAPGAKHMRLVRSGGIYTVECRPGDLVSGHCPSVDVLMASAAQHVGSNAVGVLLTGMGHDGGVGMKAMRAAGARTLAQDEASCVVYGMPKTAWEMGGAESLVPLNRIGDEVIRLLSI